jgi:PAS domain S-box-containing protein
MIQKESPASSILIIEDNEGDFVLVEAYLAHEVMPAIVHAKNFREASSILSSGDAHFDVILLDLTLPDNGGEKLITDIISLSSGSPVIVLTGYSNIEFSIKSLALGVADYLIKDEINATSLYKSIIYTIERKKSIKELEESERRYSDLFHLSPQPMWVCDFHTSQFMNVNAAAILHYGYSLEDFVNMSAKEIIAGDDEENIIEKRTVLHGEDASQDSQKIVRHRKKNGAIIQVEVQSNTMNYKGKKACITLAKDITDRLMHIEAIEKQNEKLQEIAWIQSHVVRAPLAKIMGLIDLLQNHQLTDTEKGDMFIHILNSANELDAIIKQIVKKTELIQLNNE